MGPITLFDKSFLQSLSVDESVWFDHFFLTNVCPLFYVETLADLDKSVREGRTPEQEVGLIADKFPEMHGSPNAHYADLCVSNLLGHAVPMTGQIPLAGGRLVKTDGTSGAVFEESLEAQALSRWQKREFLEVEHRYAQAWRGTLSALDLQQVAKAFRALDINVQSCKNLGEARVLAESVASGRDMQFERMKLALMFFNVPRHLQRQILQRWICANYPPLIDYAPYASYVLTVEVFFQVALAANLISSERPSNRVDIAYLFYLPFCMMFVSSDRLHQRCAPLFLRDDQEFVWGPELKDGLGQINMHYLEVPDSIRQQGVYSFAGDPPEVGNRIVAQLWHRLLPKLRERKEALADGSVTNSVSVEEVKRMADAPLLSPDEVDFDPVDAGRVLIKRRVKRRKGAWYQVPEVLENQEDRQ